MTLGDLLNNAVLSKLEKGERYLSQLEKGDNMTGPIGFQSKGMQMIGEVLAAWERINPMYKTNSILALAKKAKETFKQLSQDVRHWHFEYKSLELKYGQKCKSVQHWQDKAKYWQDMYDEKCKEVDDLQATLADDYGYKGKTVEEWYQQYLQANQKIVGLEFKLVELTKEVNNFRTTVPDMYKGKTAVEWYEEYKRVTDAHKTLAKRFSSELAHAGGAALVKHNGRTAEEWYKEYRDTLASWDRAIKKLREVQPIAVPNKHNGRTADEWYKAYRDLESRVRRIGAAAKYSEDNEFVKGL